MLIGRPPHGEGGHQIIFFLDIYRIFLINEENGPAEKKKNYRPPHGEGDLDQDTSPSRAMPVRALSKGFVPLPPTLLVK